MDTKFQLRMPVLFAAACLLKLGLLVASYLTGELWITGAALPMLVMVAYVLIGLNYRSSDVSDEKFADSCYYLGFIFTIASIIASLIDLPNIQNDMLTIATRFGVAMFSTILGLGVRVWLVSFRANLEDALRNNEQSAVEASRRLTDEYARAFHALVHFRGEVMMATTEAVKTVRDSFEEVAKENGERMKLHFEELSEHNKRHFEELAGRINYAFIENIRELKSSSMGLQRVVEKYAKETDQTLAQLNQNMGTFTGNLMSRLESVSFPDDLFSQKLAGPIDDLNGSAGEASAGLRAVARDVNAAAKSVERSVGKINAQSESISVVLDSVATIAQDQARLAELVKNSHDLALKQSQYHDLSMTKLAQQQQSVSERLDNQITNLNVMSKSASSMTEAVGTLVEKIGAGQLATENMSQLVERSHNDQQALIGALKVTMESLPLLIKETRAQSDTLVQEMNRLREDSMSTHTRMHEAFEREQGSLTKSLDAFLARESRAEAHSRYLAGQATPATPGATLGEVVNNTLQSVEPGTSRPVVETSVAP
jgi:hypothetical protein